MIFSCGRGGVLLSKLDELQRKEKWQIIFSSGGTTLYSFIFKGDDKEIYYARDIFIVDPSLSTDGKKIVFSTMKIGEKNVDIIRINSDGTGLQKLFSHLFAKGTSLSPDGKIIAFWGDHNEVRKSKNLYLYDIKENKIKLVQNDATYSETAFAPSWSPDSKQLVYASLDGYITTVNIEKLYSKKLIKGDAPSWSPDGKAIIYREGISYFRVLPDNQTTEYYIEGHRYYSIDPQGGNKKFILDGKSHFWEFAGHVYAPVVWSPDGKYILFYKPYDSLIRGPNRAKIYAMEIESGKIVFVKKQSGIPSFSWGKG